MKNNSLRVALLLVVACAALHSASAQTKLNAAVRSLLTNSGIFLFRKM
jgi:hypothetical protein